MRKLIPTNSLLKVMTNNNFGSWKKGNKLLEKHRHAFSLNLRSRWDNTINPPRAYYVIRKGQKKVMQRDKNKKTSGSIYCGRLSLD
jgi:hypothetical protein